MPDVGLICMSQKKLVASDKAFLLAPKPEYQNYRVLRFENVGEPLVPMTYYHSDPNDKTKAPPFIKALMLPSNGEYRESRMLRFESPSELFALMSFCRSKYIKQVDPSVLMKAVCRVDRGYREHVLSQFQINKIFVLKTGPSIFIDLFEKSDNFVLSYDPSKKITLEISPGPKDDISGSVVSYIDVYLDATTPDAEKKFLNKFYNIRTDLFSRQRRSTKQKVLPSRPQATQMDKNYISSAAAT